MAASSATTSFGRLHRVEHAVDDERRGLELLERPRLPHPLQLAGSSALAVVICVERAEALVDQRARVATASSAARDRRCRDAVELTCACRDAHARATATAITATRPMRGHGVALPFKRHQIADDIGQLLRAQNVPLNDGIGDGHERLNSLRSAFVKDRSCSLSNRSSCTVKVSMIEQPAGDRGAVLRDHDAIDAVAGSTSAPGSMSELFELEPRAAQLADGGSGRTGPRANAVDANGGCQASASALEQRPCRARVARRTSCTASWTRPPNAGTRRRASPARSDMFVGGIGVPGTPLADDARRDPRRSSRVLNCDRGPDRRRRSRRRPDRGSSAQLMSRTTRPPSSMSDAVSCCASPLMRNSKCECKHCRPNSRRRCSASRLHMNLHLADPCICQFAERLLVRRPARASTAAADRGCRRRAARTPSSSRARRLRVAAHANHHELAAAVHVGHRAGSSADPESASARFLRRWPCRRRGRTRADRPHLRRRRAASW